LVTTTPASVETSSIEGKDAANSVRYSPTVAKNPSSEVESGLFSLSGLPVAPPGGLGLDDAAAPIPALPVADAVADGGGLEVGVFVDCATAVAEPGTVAEGETAGVAVPAIGVAVAGTGVAVGPAAVAVGGTTVAVGGTGVAVAGRGVAVAGTGVAVGGAWSVTVTKKIGKLIAGTPPPVNVRFQRIR